jgi:hypothetical protein
LQIGGQRKSRLEVQRKLTATAIQILAIPERGQTGVQSKMVIIPSSFNFVVILRKRHSSKEQSNSESEQASDFHVILLADLVSYKSVLRSENAEPRKHLG